MTKRRVIRFEPLTLKWSRQILTQEVYDDDGVAGTVLAAFAVVGLVEQEGGHVRREDSRVDHQHQDDPVPQGLCGGRSSDRMILANLCCFAAQ